MKSIEPLVVEVESTEKGSGCLIGSRRILTARHIVIGSNREPLWDASEYSINVRLHGDTLCSRPAKLIWPRLDQRPLPDVDLAVLELQQSIDDSPSIAPMPPQLCAHPDDQGLCYGVGFPDWTVDDDQKHEANPCAVHGRIHTPQDRSGCTRLLQVTESATPLEREDWAGISGAGLYSTESGGLLGVFETALRSDGNRVLSVTCLSDIPHASDFWTASGLTPPDTPQTAYLKKAQVEWTGELRARNSVYFNQFADLIRNESIAATDELQAMRLYVRQSYRRARARVQKGTKIDPPRFRPCPADEAILQAWDVPVITLQGHPGGGKSTLLLQLALSLAEKALRQPSTSNVIPVLVNANDLATSSKSSLLEKLDEIVAQRLGELSSGRPLPERFFRRQTSAAFLILVDAFDEIASTEQRSKFVKLIGDNRMLSAQGYQFVVAGRPAAQFDEFGLESAQHFFILPFDKTRIEAFSKSWFSQLSAALDRAGFGLADSASALSQGFVDELARSGIDRLTHIPVTLMMAACVYTRRLLTQLRDGTVGKAARLPSSRAELLRNFVDISLRADVPRELRLSELAEKVLGKASADKLLDNRLRLLQRTARFMQDPPSDAGMTRRESNVLDVAFHVAEMNGWIPHADNEGRRAPLREIVGMVLDGTGLIVRNSRDGRAQFLHNTIREYLVASDLLGEHSVSNEQLWDIVRHWGVTRWREVVLMLLALTSVEPRLRAPIDQMLSRIAKSCFRGAAFAGMAIGEGTQLPEGSEVLDYVISALLAWNPCSELFPSTEFLKPNPVDVFQVMSHDIRYRRTMLKRMKGKSFDCRIAAHEFLDLTRDISTSAELWEIASESSLGSVKLAALTTLAEKWNDSVALNALIEIAKSPQQSPAMRLRAAASSARLISAEAIRDFLHDVGGSAVGLIARMYDRFQEGAQPHESELAALIANPQDDEAKATLRVLVDILSEIEHWGILRQVQQSSHVDGTNRLKLLRRMIELDASSPDISLAMRKMLIGPSKNASVILDVLRLAFETNHPDAVRLAEDAAADQNNPGYLRVACAEILATFTRDPAPLLALYRGELQATDKAEAALALWGISEERAGFGADLRRGAFDTTSSPRERLAYVEGLLQTDGDVPAKEALAALVASKQMVEHSFLHALSRLGRADLLVWLAGSSSLPPDGEETACCLIGALGDGPGLLALIHAEATPPMARAWAAHMLSRIGWLEEFEEARQLLAGREDLEAHLDYVLLQEGMISSDDRKEVQRRLFFSSSLEARLRIKLASSVDPSPEERTAFRETILQLVEDNAVDDTDFAKGLMKIDLSVSDTVSLAPNVLRRLRSMAWWQEKEKEHADHRRFAKHPLLPDIGDDRGHFGNPKGDIRIWIYEDFLCPFSRVANETIEELCKRFPEQVSIRVRHLPQNFHENADLVARIFETLLRGTPQQAWQFRELVYRSHPWQISPDQAEEIILQAGAEPASVLGVASSDSVSEILAKDAAEAADFGIEGTPGFIVNGIPVYGSQPLSSFIDVISVWREQQAPAA